MPFSDIRFICFADRREVPGQLGEHLGQSKVMSTGSRMIFEYVFGICSVGPGMIQESCGTINFWKWMEGGLRAACRMTFAAPLKRFQVPGIMFLHCFISVFDWIGCSRMFQNTIWTCTHTSCTGLTHQKLYKARFSSLRKKTISCRKSGISTEKCDLGV